MYLCGPSTKGYLGVRCDRVRRSVRAAAVSQIPDSLEDAIDRAGVAVRQRLDKRVSNRKSFKKTPAARLAVEISLADEGPDNVISVVAGLLKPLARNLRESSTLAFYDIDTALVASATFPDNEVVSIQDSNCSVQNELLYVFGCPTGQEEDALPLLKRWRGGAVIWVSFDMRSMEQRLTSSRRTFETVFAFEPLAVKGLLRTQEAFILKQPEAGKAGLWQIFKKAWGEYKLIGQIASRPTASDIEMSFYNASAAESPIIKGIKAFKALTKRTEGAKK